MHKIRSVPIVLLVVLFLVAALAVRCGGTAGRATADLSSITSDVERYDGQAGSAEPVPEGDRRTMYEGDGVGVDDAGYAHLDMGGCLLEIFRRSGLQIGGLPSQSAPVCIVDFEQGTIYNRVKRQTIIQTEWAVITSLSTEFLVHLDPDRGLLWVVVVDGVVRVEAAGRIVVLQAGEQTWVPRGRPPEPPRPATRAEVGDLFPPVEELTNGEMSDPSVLAGPAVTERPTPTAAELAACQQEITFDELASAQPGQVFDLSGIQFRLSEGGPEGGQASYFLEDCNDDGAQDLFLGPGVVQMDFGRLSCPVEQVDVDVLDFAGLWSGALVVESEGGFLTGSLSSAPGEPETLQASSEESGAGRAIVEGVELCVTGVRLQTRPLSAGLYRGPQATYSTEGASFADELRIRPRGAVRYELEAPQLELFAGLDLQRAELWDNWFDTWDSFTSREESNPGGPNNQITTLSFTGNGAREADQGTAVEGAASISNELRRRAEVVFNAFAQ